MELLFEKSIENRHCCILPECDVPEIAVPDIHKRIQELKLPELSENEISRHYSSLERASYGVNDGFYPLGSCTMKYNPKINEQIAGLPGFTDIHPLQPENTVQGCLEVLSLAEKYLCEITGMDAVTFQPAAGAHGELTGLMLIKKYHEKNSETRRDKIIVPDSAHGTNPATAAMCGMTVINISSGSDGLIDLDELKNAAGSDTAGLMLTNPNTLGLFEKEIISITKIIKEAGGLVYYDGANLNPIMGIVRPGDMGFDCIHLNLHKTFSTPHGGGGPGSGAVGCKEFLAPFLPKPVVAERNGAYSFDDDRPESIGRIIGFYGNFLVVVKALAYITTLGREGLTASAKDSALNANYLMKRLSERYDIACEGMCMHEFVISMAKEKKEKDITAMDIAKALIDSGIHPPTMYFPLIVQEALMVEPTETEGKEGLDKAADIFLKVYDEAMSDPEQAKRSPARTQVRRPDEIKAAREPVLRYI